MQDTETSQHHNIPNQVKFLVESVVNIVIILVRTLNGLLIEILVVFKNKHINLKKYFILFFLFG